MIPPDIHITKLLCNSRYPSKKEWEVYFTKQMNPLMDVEEIASALNLSEKKVRHALSRFKIYSGKFLYIPSERFRKAVEILEKNYAIPEVDNAFLEGINFCPRWIHPDDIFFLLDIPDEWLTPETRLYLLTSILMDDDRMHEMGYENLMFEIISLRKQLHLQGLRFSYMMSLVPFLIIAAQTMTSYPLDEVLDLKKYVRHFPPLYRDMYELAITLVNKLRKKNFMVELIEELERAGTLDSDVELIKLFQTGKFEEASRLEIDFDQISEPFRTLLRVIQYISLVYSSPVQPPPPPFEESEDNFLTEVYRLSAKALYARLIGEDYRRVVMEDDPTIGQALEKFYFEPDITYFRHHYNWYLSELIIKIHRGEVDKAWEIAKENYLLGDFYTTYILMGKPIYLLPYRYRLRIPWIPARVRIEGEKLKIFYMDGEMEFRGRVVELMREIIEGNGLLRKSDFRYLKKRLWFLKFRVRDGKYAHMVEVELDEEID